MPSMKITSGLYSGARNTFGKKGIGAAIRALAIDHALIKINAMTKTDIKFTDNSTGTAGSSVADVAVPTSSIVASSGSAGAGVATLNTALGKVEDAMAILAKRINVVRSPLGLDLLGQGPGATTTPGTIAALDKSVTGASGASAAAFGSGVAALRVAKNNLRMLVSAANETLVALGQEPIKSNLTSKYSAASALADIPTVAASAAGGATVLAKTGTDAALLSIANSVATLSAQWNTRIDALAASKLHIVAAE